MVQADFIQRRRRGVRRDVAADAVLDLVRLDDHRQRIPSHQALDAALDFAAARKWRLLRGGNRVDVGRVRGEGRLDAAEPRMIREQRQQPSNARRPSGLQHVIERLEPFARLESFELGRVFRCCITHVSS
jgi:hypothetical protein